MKYLLFALLLGCTSASFSQIDSESFLSEEPTNWTWYQQSDTFFKNLDFSSVPDDLLLEHGFPLVDFDNYRGDTSDMKAYSLSRG